MLLHVVMSVPSPRLSVLRDPTEILGTEAVRQEKNVYITHDMTK